MKMQYVCLCVTAAMMLTLMGCAHPNSKASQSAAATAPQKDVAAIPQVASSPDEQKVMKEGGWEIPGLAQGKVTQPRTVFRSSDVDGVRVYWAWLRPEAQEGEEFIIEDAYFSADERKTLRLIPGEQAVMKIARYDVGERVFCYQVTIHPKGIGAMNALVYYDEDGDGRFETVERGSVLPSFVPRIPQWTRQAN